MNDEFTTSSDMHQVKKQKEQQQSTKHQHNQPAGMAHMKETHHLIMTNVCVSE